MARATRRVPQICGAAALGVCSTIIGFSTQDARAGNVILNGGYHAQTTDHWCAAASLEMMLDVPAVRNNNAIVNQMLGVGDGPTVPSGTPDPTTTIVINNGVGTVTSRAQAFIYGLNHGLNTVNGIGYSNPFAPVGAGTDNNGIQVAANLLDNPAANGAGNPAFAFGTHSYTGYNLAPNFVGATLASRTIANALTNYNVPAQATVESGAHAICVYGVSTNGVAANNQNYTINGFLIHDPWTGYVASQLSVGNAAPLAAGGWGLGFNTYLRYGYDIVPGGALTQLPNGNVVPVRLGAWFNYFNPSGGQPGAGPVFATPGMKFTVEPIGPELPDTGDPLNDGGLPAPPSELPELNASQAGTDATNDLAADATLNTESGLSGGHLDLSDEVLMQMPGDVSGQGDWLVPYDGAGGINDVTGAVMIDAATGVIDEATWLDPSDGLSSLTLAQLDEMFADQANGVHPNDNSVPEPGSMLILGIAMISLNRRGRRS
jgi:hypothetical protein